MANSKTVTLTFRIDPGQNEGSRIAALTEHCSIANTIEFPFRNSCEQQGIATP
ncbi:MAG: hypothetical protein ACOYLF_12605 [Blastocatellia bacterium]|jgi:hypothetical protein